MKEKEFAQSLIDRLNAIQTEYNPTNQPFQLVETHDEKNQKIIINVSHHDYENNTIIHNEVYKYNEYRDSIVKYIYAQLNRNILRSLLITQTYINMIKKIGTLEDF